jgi:hypothetical protein
MNLDYVEGLLFSSITISHHGKSILIPNVVVDTGAAESIISIDAVAALWLELVAGKPPFEGRSIS